MARGNTRPKKHRATSAPAARHGANKKRGQAKNRRPIPALAQRFLDAAAQSQSQAQAQAEGTAGESVGKKTWDIHASTRDNAMKVGLAVLPPRRVAPRMNDDVVSESVLDEDDISIAAGHSMLDFPVVRTTLVSKSGKNVDESQATCELPNYFAVAKPPKEAKLSEGEQHYYAKLVQRYGDDYAAMARDIKLNNYQHGPRLLEKKCKIWRNKYEKGVAKGRGHALEVDGSGVAINKSRGLLSAAQQQAKVKRMRKRK